MSDEVTKCPKCQSENVGPLKIEGVRFISNTPEESEGTTRTEYSCRSCGQEWSTIKHTPEKVSWDVKDYLNKQIVYLANGQGSVFFIVEFDAYTQVITLRPMGSTDNFVRRVEDMPQEFTLPDGTELYK